MKKYKIRFSVNQKDYEEIIFNNWHECFNYFKFFIQLSGRKVYPFISSKYFRNMVDNDRWGIKIKLTDEIDLNKIMVGFNDHCLIDKKEHIYFTLFVQEYTFFDEIIDKKKTQG